MCLKCVGITGTPTLYISTIHVQDSITFKGVQDDQDVQYSYILYQLISNGCILYLYTFKMFRLFRIHISYNELFQTDTQISTNQNVIFILTDEHIEQITPHLFNNGTPLK